LITELYDWDWPTAEREFRRAIQLDPNYATGHQWYAEFLGFQGRFPEAFAESERARQLDPLSLVIASDDCAIRVFARQYDRAIAECASVLEREPSFARAHTLLIGAYLERSRFFEAVRQVRSWVKTTNDPASHSFEAYVYARAGQPQKARQEFAEFRRARLDPRVGPGPLEIWAYMSIGDNDAALAVLQRAVARRSNAITDIKVNPAYDPLRSDPRFQAILHQVHLDQ
jgi:tetratricopeptide (TPR) repeat protein